MQTVQRARKADGEWETLKEHQKRIDIAFKATRKQHARESEYRAGLRKADDLPALWTAARWTGATYEKIAGIENQDTSTITKAVGKFSKRIGLTLATSADTAISV